MPKADTNRATPRRKPRFLAVRVPRKRRHGWHWFDHPEMQARIREFEEERDSGQLQTFDSIGATGSFTFSMDRT